MSADSNRCPHHCPQQKPREFGGITSADTLWMCAPTDRLRCRNTLVWHGHQGPRSTEVDRRGPAAPRKANAEETRGRLPTDPAHAGAQPARCSDVCRDQQCSVRARCCFWSDAPATRARRQECLGHRRAEQRLRQAAASGRSR